MATTTCICREMGAIGPGQSHTRCPYHAPQKVAQAQTLTDVRNRYAGQPCTLNGMDAVISGGLVATVRSLDGRLVGQWSWLAVERIMQADAAFKF